MAALAGYGGRLTLGASTQLPVGRWTANTKADDLDITTFEQTAGAPLVTPASSWLAGITDIDGTFDAFWDTTVDALNVQASANVVPGGTYKLSLFYDKNSATRNFILNALVTNVSMDCEVRGVVKYTCSFRHVGGSLFVTATTALGLPNN